MTEISFSSLDQLQQAISNLTGPQVIKVGERAGQKIALELLNTLSRKPGPSHQPVLWDSEKQRRAYFAQRRKDGLDPKYRRHSDPWSQKSSVTWATRKITGGTLLGNPATYAPHVYSHQYQTRQHKATGWTTDKEAADQAFRDGTVARHVLAEVDHMVREAFRGLG
jgi:hypothetical protein